MASIRVRQRKDGTTYTSVLYSFAGKQTSSSFNDHAEALRFQDVCNRLGPVEVRRIWGTAAPKDGPTVASYIHKHLDALSGVEKKTLAEYRRYLTRDIEPVLGTVPLSSLTRTDISRWVNGMRADGASGKTIRNKFTFLSGCLKHAVKDGLIADNPAVGVRLPRTVRREPTFLTPEEFALLRGAFALRWWPLLDFLVASGCRFSEATALTPADVDQAHGTVRITRAWKRVPGGREVGQPKTNKSIRTINVPTSVLDGLDYSHEFLFTTITGEPVRLSNFHTQVWTPGLAKARADGLTKRPRIHDLRHSCASWLIQSHTPLAVVQAHLGHESIEITVGTYGHLDRSAGQVAADAIANLLR
jgi:integrase